MLYMYVYTYVGKKEGREGVQNGEEEQRLYIFAIPSFWDLGSKKILNQTILSYIFLVILLVLLQRKLASALSLCRYTIFACSTYICMCTSQSCTLLTTSVRIFPPKFVLGNVQRPNVRLFLPIFGGNLYFQETFGAQKLYIWPLADSIQIMRFCLVILIMN